MTTFSSSRATPVHGFMVINGDRIEEGDRREVFNPARPSEVVGTSIRGTNDSVNAAIAAAKDAQPKWAARSFSERASILEQSIAGLVEGLDGRAEILVRENGKTLAEAVGELKAVMARSGITLALAAGLDAPRQMSAPSGHTLIGYLPYGVVVAIVPWNSPVTLASMQILPALLTGNAVVLKVPDSAPLALTLTAALLAERLPRGLLNIVSGKASEIGDALTAHPDVSKITFVGSVPSARQIITNAAQTIKSFTAELGGNDAAIVLDDATLDPSTMRRMARSVFRMSGQVCMAIKRIYVPENIHDSFVRSFAQVVDEMVVGDGLVEGVTMGPLHNKAGLERGRRLIAEAAAGGGKVRELGSVDDPRGFEQGYFMRPTLITDVTDSAAVVAEEQFCPAIPVVRYRELDEAVASANDSIFGLGGSVWGADVDRATQVAQRIQAGTVFVNTHGTENVNRAAPYGGVKQSGGGRRSGIEGLMEYMQTQTLTTFEE